MKLLRQQPKSIPIDSGIRRRTVTAMAVLAMSLVTFGCNEQSVWKRPPNVVGTAVVETITKKTQKAFGEISSTYLVKLTQSTPSDLNYVYVPGKIADDDMAGSIGGNVTVKCYRETPSDYCYASSYSYSGREFIEGRN